MGCGRWCKTVKTPCWCPDSICPTVFWTDQIHTDLLSFWSFCNLNLLGPTARFQQHQVSDERERGGGVFMWCMCVFVDTSGHEGRDHVLREFLQEDHVVVRVPNQQGDIVVVGSRPLRQQILMVLQVHRHHDLCSGNAVSRKLRQKFI